MKTAILTFSQTGNTLRVGTTISHALRHFGIQVDHARFRDRGDWQPADADLIGVGAPVFENHPVECVIDFLRNHAEKWTGKQAFVFITSGGSPARSLWRLANAVETTGARVIGGVQIRGATTVPTMFGLFADRPNQADLDHATAFGNALGAAINDGIPMPIIFQINPTAGGRLYDRIGPWLTFLKKSITPPPQVDTTRCNGCGICASECPTANFTSVQEKPLAGDACIVCYRCWHVCPNGAITIRFSPGRGWLERTLYHERMERRFGNIRPDETVGPNLYKAVLDRQIRLSFNRHHPTADFTIAKD